jgi:hypothetical protein
MSTKLQRKKKQRTGWYELEYEELAKPKKGPTKRASTRKYYSTKVTYCSMREEEYLNIADRIVGLSPESHRMTILTSEGQQEFDQDDDEID